MPTFLLSKTTLDESPAYEIFFFFSSFPGRGALRGDGLLLAENTSPSSLAVHWTCHDDEVGSWVSPSFFDATGWAVVSFSFSLWHTLLHDIYSGVHMRFTVPWTSISIVRCFCTQIVALQRLPDLRVGQCFSINNRSVGLQDYSQSFKLTSKSIRTEMFSRI